MRLSLVAALALAAATALPAAANAASKHKHVRVITHPYAARAYVPAYRYRSSNDVYVNGKYVGSDPDPRIRDTLKREYMQEWGGR